MKYYFADNYYYDIDHLNQLRITGPENHLLCGLSFANDFAIEISSAELDDRVLTLTIPVAIEHLELHVPLVTDIRTLRHHTEKKDPPVRYYTLATERNRLVLPEIIEWRQDTQLTKLRVFNRFEDKEARFYGCEMLVPPEVNVSFFDRRIFFDSATPYSITIKTYTNIFLNTFKYQQLFADGGTLNLEKLPAFLRQLYLRLGNEVDYLIRSKKTSSFEYGTIFPRDWIEAADLGQDNLTPQTYDFMYEQSMKYISEAGEGWHEEVIGHYRTRVKDQALFIDRKMIDIEPHYVLGLSNLSWDFLQQSDIYLKFKNTARFIMQQAEQQNLITFKRRPESEEYYLVGNWRDSQNAFADQISPIAPYDVNYVFYPQALKEIKKHARYLEIDELDKLDELIAKWDQSKQRFVWKTQGLIDGFYLALQGLELEPVQVAHLDESYDLFYAKPSEDDVVRFAQKVIDPDYFYTPGGPMLVASSAEYYNTKQYHGKVIWPKQVAFAVVGLCRQLERGKDEEWSEASLAMIKKALKMTCEASFTAWEQLDSVPELYYYDFKQKRSRFYIDQEGYMGQMSLVQLWSAVGARRIMREYLKFFGD